ncbi:hypothetical protein AB0K02_23470 [Streptomyces sp. NPDC049597]|uniref:hypothetical protein n=1 Tax=Streptomyces sp. NPDC049597 TaxID=3155276 RepID=UPI00343C3F23
MTEAFGESHEGIVGAVLSDGSEPQPVYLDVGSGSGSGCRTGEWWAYDGQMGRPKGASYRAACACGWRGESYPIDWKQADDSGLQDIDTSRPHIDWVDHIHCVERRTVPLPDEISETLGRLEEQLTRLAEQAPATALKAVATLERLTRDVGREAASAAEADELSPKTIGQALGISPGRARSRLAGYLLAR